MNVIDCCSSRIEAKCENDLLMMMSVDEIENLNKYNLL